jgi:Fe-S-cluster-containing dehydrogenase component
MVSGAAAAAAGVVAEDNTIASSEQVKPLPDAVGMLYDATLCIGCKACVVACTEANNLKPDTGSSGGIYQAPVSLNANTKNLIKLYRKGEERSFMKACIASTRHA